MPMSSALYVIMAVVYIWFPLDVSAKQQGPLNITIFSTDRLILLTLNLQSLS
ncbi:hypothetical protein HYPBUDRAFT_152286 [Hyphopichia burtonii NRRL Y-1933]|uniref:Uncharacterized protein n=1 Tax=Hyphopichia burtonii NRRL Y-1933 TaxID=984485 RepID=A0A1E4RPF9_9ASCO|nr:hypothetical protein HYPBUDRAFT_152286 [Hyphopichia burtonii NRRL Y-1933]ODV69101.1 hypothetical protein HYPBUDRAFT_152286 [Hyphopichia burtonii NRRL Y-1933]